MYKFRGQIRGIRVKFRVEFKVKFRVKSKGKIRDNFRVGNWDSRIPEPGQAGFYLGKIPKTGRE